jgi:putative spermidine/putrescine transport system substrate-binding protein
MKKSRLMHSLALVAVLALVLGACGTPAAAPTATSAPVPTAVPPTKAPAPTAVPPTAVPPTAVPVPTVSAMDQLVADAKAEGQLTTIALPHDWCNYGGMIDGFKAKYGLTVNELNPDAGSGDEVQAIIANKDNKGPQAPDVVDVGLSFGPQLISDKLAMPYKVSTWDTIPDGAKNADGYWYGDYYGVLSFEVNQDLVKNSPKDWPDLLKPEYANQVALAGDPRKSSQGINGVYASALANGGSLDNAQPGLDFFKKLNDAGNFVPIIGKAGPLAQGATPIIIRWDYLALADRDTLAGNPPVDVVVPSSGVFAGVYVQAISAYAPHPNAAKLWMEYLYSDEGQLQWLKGYCHPIRYNDLAKNNKIPADISAKLPPADAYAKAVFPTLDQIAAAGKTITENWDKVTGVTAISTPKP